MFPYIRWYQGLGIHTHGQVLVRITSHRIFMSHYTLLVSAHCIIVRKPYEYSFVRLPMLDVKSA